jgi:hypothetical protein
MGTMILGTRSLGKTMGLRDRRVHGVPGLRFAPGSGRLTYQFIDPGGTMLLIIIIVLLVLWTPGYYGYGRSRWGWSYGGDLLTLILVIVLIWILLGR